MSARRLALGLVSLVLLLAARGRAEEAAPPAAAPAFVGQEACAACHVEQAEAYAKTPHAAPLADAARPEALRGCEACHGPGGAHAEQGGGKGVGNLTTFARDRPAPERSAVCLRCHAGAESLHDMKASAHALSGVACTDCHRIHGGAGAPLLARAVPDLCYGCHLDVRAKFALPERHAVSIATPACLDCHRAHGGRTRPALRGANDRECFRCHGEFEGPFVYEHAGLVVEGCARCHDPHGSVNRHLLIRQQVAQLCYECHTVTPSTHLQPSYRDCTRCHVAIHGSNVDPRFLEQ